MRAPTTLTLLFTSLSLSLGAIHPRLASHLARRVVHEKRADLPDPNCSPATKFFTQKLDHTDATNTETWQHQFQIVTDYFKPGGPIFFFQGEETRRMECVESTILKSWAQQTGGIAAALEHRYFGHSLPLGNASLTSVQGLRYLTLENVIGDAEEFVRQVRANITGAALSPVAVVSGSYGGFLMAAFRQNSKVFDAVVASASPIRAMGNDPPNNEGWLWWQFASDVYTNDTSNIADKIVAGFAAFKEAYDTDMDSLVPALAMCAPPNDPQYVYTDYTTAIATPLFLYPEFNYPFASPGRVTIANSYEVIKEAILAVPDDQPLQVLNVTIWNWWGPLRGYDRCFDPPVDIAGITPLIEGLPFDYIICTYMPLDTGDIPEGTIFPAVPHSYLQGFPDFCNGVFGNNTVHTMTEAEIYARYHISPAELQASTGIIFSQGGWDPTTSVSVPSNYQNPQDPKSYASRRLFVKNMAHREDLFAPNPNDRPEVTALRQQELDTIMNWFTLV